MARLQGISQRATIAFTIGTAEWIVHRFARISSNPIPLQYLEAAWAMSIEFRYCRVTWDEYKSKSDEWVGPIGRPLGLALTRVEYTFEAAIEYGNPEISGAWITNLAQYVLTDPEPYRAWRERVMQRLESLYRFDAREKLGEVVPREALDPDFDFRIELT